MKKAVKSALVNRIRLLPCFLLLLVLVTGCATVPEPEEGGYPGLLYRRGSVLFILNVEADRELSEFIVSKVMDQETVERFLDRTDKLYVRLFESEEAPETESSDAGLRDGAGDDKGLGTGSGTASGETVFELIAEGKYPRRLSGFALKRQGWEKKSEPSLWWNSSEDNLQIAFPSSRIAAVSRGNMEGLLSRIHEPESAAAFPERVNTLSEYSSLYVYGVKPQLSSYVNRRIERLLSKVEEFEMGFYLPDAEENDAPTGDDAAVAGRGDTYRIEGEYRFSEESTARSFLLSLRLALLSRAGAVGKEAVMELVEKRYVTQQGKSVGISGMRIRPEDIDLLFGIFTPQF